VTRALTDKLTQRRLLAAAGVDDTACAEVAAPDAVAQALAAVGLPAIMKPRRGTGSLHVRRVENPDEAAAAAREFFAARPGETLVAEQLLAGDQRAAGAAWGDYVSVEAAVHHGRYQTLCLTGRFPLVEPFRERGFFVPATLGAPLADRVMAVAEGAALALGVRHGIVHTEIKLTPAGPRVVEVNGRAGGPVSDLLRRGAGFDLVGLGLRLALGIPPDPAGPRFGGVTYLYVLLPPYDASAVLAIDGAAALRELDGVDLVDIRAAPGQPVDWRDGAFGVLGWVYGRAADHAALAELAERIEAGFGACYSYRPAFDPV
jgi:biotin carboxylase